MRIAFVTFSDRGAVLAVRLGKLLNEDSVTMHSVPKFALKYGFCAHESVRTDMGRLFSENDALIFFCACGIAVRIIAPFLKSKTEDPAVLVIDDQGKFVISLLSGHIGGANRLAERIAEMIDAEPVITTATDGAGRFSCDAWAAAHQCSISSLETAKEISAAILTEEIPVISEFALPEKLPEGLIYSKYQSENRVEEKGIYIGIRKMMPFARTLRLTPRIVTLGVGCKRGTEPQAIKEVISEVLEKENIDPFSVAGIATIDVKKDEKGLLDYAGERNLPIKFFDAKELALVEDLWGFAESDFVRRIVGVGNVCERAAVLGAGLTDKELLCEKCAYNGMTLAVAKRKLVIDWDII
mgnify:CR=1 FL=1